MRAGRNRVGRVAAADDEFALASRKNRGICGDAKGLRRAHVHRALHLRARRVGDGDLRRTGCHPPDHVEVRPGLDAGNAGVGRHDRVGRLAARDAKPAPLADRHGIRCAGQHAESKRLHTGVVDHDLADHGVALCVLDRENGGAHRLGDHLEGDLRPRVRRLDDDEGLGQAEGIRPRTAFDVQEIVSALQVQAGGVGVERLAVSGRNAKHLCGIGWGQERRTGQGQRKDRHDDGTQ